MKNNIAFAACIAALFTFGRASAQSHDASFNLAPMVFSNYSINYSLNMNDNVSLGTVLGYQNIEVTSTDDEKIGYKGFYIAPECRYYFNPDRRGNTGFFAGGYMKYRNMRTTGNVNSGFDVSGRLIDYDMKNSGLAIGGMIGKMWVANIGVIFSVWGGLGYYVYNSTTYTNGFTPRANEDAPSLPPLDFRFGLSVGYRFNR
jgi:hypothetical protein